MLDNTQAEVQLIFMESLKSPTDLIIYPVVSMQTQKLSHRHFHLRFLARVYLSQITYNAHGTYIIGGRFL